MVPDLLRVPTMILTKMGDDQSYPNEQESSSFFDDDFNPVPPWRQMIAGVPDEIAVGSANKNNIRIGYSRLSLRVAINPDELMHVTIDGNEIPIALVQRTEVLTAYIAVASWVGAFMKYGDDHTMKGSIYLDITHVKRLLDRVV